MEKGSPSFIKKLNDLKNTPLGEIDADKVKDIIDDMLERKKTDNITIDVARFGSSI